MERKIFTIRIIYKSGVTQDFDVYKFAFKRNGMGGDSYEWESVGVQCIPIQIGADDIAAVWQVGVRDE